MQSIKRRLSLSIRRSRSNFVDESISELGENGDNEPTVAGIGICLIRFAFD